MDRNAFTEESLALFDRLGKIAVLAQAARESVERAQPALVESLVECMRHATQELDAELGTYLQTHGLT